ncbi:MAG: 1-acyl-sn-glycerol-3-phosphate acyltransferase [bacterium]|jgi:1-acyl-sn-glycerol-3-phosphate acyltransferase|nr:1-acyl-sn-glycerol-3-phosphate acyltransferase [Spirochaetales bacterium]MDT3390337.1 1-acyl-sn-glycerol-3-phosphate acyltransferase [bacterium]
MIYVLWGLIIILAMTAVAMVTAVIPALLMRLVGLGKLSDRLIFWHAAVISNTGMWLAGIRVHVSGDVESIRKRVDKGEGFCFVANHTSILDIVLMLGRLRARTGFVAKIELLFAPLINVMIAMTHSVFINRRNLRASIDAIHKAGENIRKGHSMVIFPEGTRSKTGEIAPFKHGAFRMATESGACVVPLTVKGLRDSLEDRKHFFQRRDCYLHVGNPAKAPSAENRSEVAEFISDIEGQVRKKYAEL